MKKRNTCFWFDDKYNTTERRDDNITQVNL